MKFSVIIPVFNAEKYLSKCLESIINQTYDNWEVIALDDGSQDNSFSIMKKYSRLNGKIKVATKSNEGPGLTRNRCRFSRASSSFPVIFSFSALS